MPLDNPYDRFGYDVPDTLMASLVFHESSGNPGAESGAGAVGLTQLMPGTAKEMGVTDRTDPKQSLEGGKKYLKKYVDKYDGDYEKALIAYNWGPGNVARKGAENAPEESKAYARKVLAKAGMGPKPKPVTGFETAPQDTMAAAVRKADRKSVGADEEPPALDDRSEAGNTGMAGILSWADTAKRRIKDFVQNPVASLSQGVTQMSEDIQRGDPSSLFGGGIIKPVGGQWLTHNLQPAFDEIKKKLASGTVIHGGLVDELEASAKNAGTHQAWLDQHAGELKKSVALNDWIDSTMMGYVKKRMGTEKDEIRKLADQGIVHEDLGGQEYMVDEARKRAGFPEEGVATTVAGKGWEGLADAQVFPSSAGSWQGHKNPTGLLKTDLEALKKAPPDATVYNVADYFSPKSLGFDHIVDVIEGDLNSGRLRSDNLNKFTMEAAVRRTHEVDQAAIKAVQADKAALLPKIQEHNAKLTPYASYETPQGKVNWYKYDKTVDPEDIAYGLSVDSQFMGHCVGGVGHGEAGYKGYVPMRNLQTGKPVAAKYPLFNSYADDVKNGNTEIFSLRNEKGEPVATIETGKKFDEGDYDTIDTMVGLNSNAEEKMYDEVGGDRPVMEYVNWVAENHPWAANREMAKNFIQLQEHNDSVVKQIKGPNNGKVDPKYQPMIRKFLGEGGYSGIRDLDNAGLIQIGEDQGGKSQFVTEQEIAGAWKEATGKEVKPTLAADYYNELRADTKRGARGIPAADKKFLALVAAAAAGTASAAEQQGALKVASDNSYDQFDKENPYAQFDEGVGEDYAPKIDPQTGKQFDPEIPTRMALDQSKARDAKTREEKLARKSGRNGGHGAIADTLIDELAGPGETIMTLGSGLAAGAVANPVGIVQSLAEGDGSKAEQRASEFMQSVTYQPRSEAGKRNVEAISEAFDKSKLAGIAPELSEVSNVGAAVRPAIRQVSEAVAPGGRQALKEAVGSVGRDVLSGAGRPVAPAGFEKPWKSGMITPQAAQLAQKAESMGIKVPLHALVDNKLVKMLGGFLSDITGGNEAKNKAAFNDYLASHIGAEKTGALTYGKEGNFASAMQDSGRRIGEVYAATNVPIAGQLDSGLGKLSTKVEARAGDSPRVVGGWIAKLRELGDRHNGTIPGNIMQQFNTDLGDEIRKMDGLGDMGLVRDGLNDLQETINDSVLRNASPELKKQFQVARKQYAIGKKLEPLVAKAQLSGISPTDLIGAVTQTKGGKHRMAMGVDDVLGSAAAIAQNFMKEEGTMLNAPERRLALGAAGVGAMALPAILPEVGGAIGGSLLYNRYGPKVAKGVIERALPPKAIEDSALVKGPRELSTEPPAFAPKPEAPKEAPQPRPTMELSDKGQVPGHGVPDEKLLAKRHDIPERTIDFPLRQEVIEKLGPVIDEFRAEHKRLSDLLADPKTSKGDITRLRTSINALEKRFLDGARQLGAKSAADMHGLRRMLYEGAEDLPLPGPMRPGDLKPIKRTQTQLPVEHTFNPKGQRGSVTPGVFVEGMEELMKLGDKLGRKLSSQEARAILAKGGSAYDRDREIVKLKWGAPTAETPGPHNKWKEHRLFDEVEVVDPKSGYFGAKGVVRSSSHSSGEPYGSYVIKTDDGKELGNNFLSSGGGKEPIWHNQLKRVKTDKGVRKNTDKQALLEDYYKQNPSARATHERTLAKALNTSEPKTKLKVVEKDEASNH